MSASLANRDPAPRDPLGIPTGRRLRLVVINPRHWHFPLYWPGLTAAGVEFAGICDLDDAQGRALAERLGCPLHTRLDAALDGAGADFVFAFGPHRDLPVIGHALVDRGLPFSIEKPGGLDADAVAGLARAAEAKGLFASVPFHYRLSDMDPAIRGLVGDGRRLRDLRLRINAKSPPQHRETSPWLTDPAIAGGGCVINLAHHPLDYVVGLVGSMPRSVSATMGRDALGLAVEDTARIRLDFDSGGVCVIEVGYTQPRGEGVAVDFGIELRHEAFSAVSMPERLRITDAGAARSVDLPMNWNLRTHFADYATHTLARFLCGQPPVATLGDLHRTMLLVDAAYESARTGRPVPIGTLADGGAVPLQSRG